MRRAVATSAFHALLRSPMRPTAATATAAALSRRPLLATSSFSAFTTNASNAVSRSKRPADAKKGMQIAFFSAHQYDIDSMTSIAQKEGIADDHELLFFENRLSVHNAQLATGCEGVVIFVNDTANEAALRKLYANGTRALFLRCAGYDMVDLNITKELDMPVMRVPAYSPFAIAEHAAALMMTLNRKIHRSFNRTREQNFRLDGLLGSDINGKTVGVIGTGKIGALFARICSGFGC
ncbi:2-hydroxyacid dehydrogenase, partial [Globisporangium polare]